VANMEKEQAPAVGERRPTSRDNAPLIFEGARGTAVKLLCRYESSDSYIDKLLDGELRRGELQQADKALVTELVCGTVRWQARLDWILAGFYHGDYPKCLPIVRNALRIALYQMLFLSKIPPAAAINESVEIVKRFKGDKSAGIANGVLRNILRNITNLRYPPKDDDLATHLAVLYSHPKWMVKRYIDRYGDAGAEELMAANNHRPMLTLRVNAFKSSIDEVTQALTQAEIKWEPSPVHPGSIMITSLRDVRASPLFEQGMITIQDASASLAVQLASPKPGMTVYDLCAAPGGKAVHAAELMQNTGKLIALEKYESKLALISENASRAGVTIVEPMVGDAATFAPEGPADLVLVDAPCSGLGTMSKKPDIKWRRTMEDVRSMARFQASILDHAATLVKAGGTVVYSTCTTEPEENAMIVQDFLNRHTNFTLDDAAKYVDAAVVVDGMVQTLPHKHRCDGAFAARLVKTS
jgi:16S rRNA (cytosine967-C5)-methyltransferase